MSGKVLAAVLLASVTASAASRPRYGGSLEVGHLTIAEGTPPILRDSPLEASLLATEVSPLCVLRGTSAQPVLAHSLERIDGQRLRITLRPALRTSRHGTLNAAAVARSLEQAARATSPYRGLLAPLLRTGRRPAITVTGPLQLELAASHPWPDLATSLCHPALSIVTERGDGLGPFTPSQGAAPREALLTFPAGRPFVDRLTTSALDERALLRAFGLGKVKVTLGASPAPEGATSIETPRLFATYLAYSPTRLGADFRALLEAEVDREDLARYFARAPAEPMPELLPPSLLPGASRSRKTVSSPGRELTLLYDESLPDHRALAERVQARLHARGFRIALQPRSRESLRQSGSSADLSLQSVLLPPSAPAALGVVLALAGQDALLSRELSALGRIEDPAAREDAARKRALALRESLPLIPLVAQGLVAFAAPGVAGLHSTPSGLVALDGISLEPPAP